MGKMGVYWRFFNTFAEKLDIKYSWTRTCMK